MVTAEDIVRVMLEYDKSGKGPEEILAKYNIDPEALASVADAAMLKVIMDIDFGVNSIEAITNAMCNVFVLGWECGMELGKAAIKDG